MRSTSPRARLAVDGEPPERRAAGQHRACAERERLDDVRAAADPAVDEHLDAAADRLDDLRQHVDRRGDAVELPAAVVRDDDPRGAVLAREARVLGGEHALDEHRQPRLAGEPLDVAPRQRRRDRVEHLRRRQPPRPSDGDARSRRDREAGAVVALATAAHRRVDRQHERA